jgi:hypothetical protein
VQRACKFYPGQGKEFARKNGGWSEVGGFAPTGAAGSLEDLLGWKGYSAGFKSSMLTFQYSTV